MASFAGSPARFREIEKQVYLKLDTDPRDMSSGDGNRKKNQSQAKEEFQRFCQRKNLRPKFINVPGYGKNTVKVTLRVQDGDKEMMIRDTGTSCMRRRLKPVKGGLTSTGRTMIQTETSLKILPRTMLMRCGTVEEVATPGAALIAMFKS